MTAAATITPGWTLSAALERFLADVECAPSTLRIHHEHAKGVLKWFGDRAVADFAGPAGAALILEYIQAETGGADRGLRERFGGRGNLVRALSYSSIRQRVAALKGALRAAVNAGELDAMPEPWPIVLQLAAERAGMPKPESEARKRRVAPTVRASGAEVQPGDGIFTLRHALEQMQRSSLRVAAPATRLIHAAHESYLLRFFGDRPLADFEGSGGYRLLDEYVVAEGPDGRGAKYCTLKKRLVTLRMALKEAQRRGQLNVMPPWPRLPADTTPRQRYLTHHEYAKVRAVLPARERTFVDLGIWTGQHSSDICTMTWGTVDLGAGPGAGPGGGRAFWGRRNTKNRQGLVWLPMPDALRAHLTAAWRALESVPRPTDPIVGNVDRFNMRKAIGRACWRVGIAPFAPIDLRHTCVTWWIERGGPKDGLKKWLGHSGSSQMIDRFYLSVTPAMLDDGVAALNRVGAARAPIYSAPRAIAQSDAAEPGQR